MQLDTARYKAIAPDRGASLDTLDYPLNNRPWLKGRFAWMRSLKSEAERMTGSRFNIRQKDLPEIFIAATHSDAKPEAL